MKSSQIRGKLRINSKPIPSQANEEGVETEREQPKDPFLRLRDSPLLLNFERKMRRKGEVTGSIPVCSTIILAQLIYRFKNNFIVIFIYECIN